MNIKKMCKENVITKVCTLLFDVFSTATWKSFSRTFKASNKKRIYVKYIKIYSPISPSHICHSDVIDLLLLNALVVPKEAKEKFGGKSNELIKPSAVYFRTAITLLE